ncbi:MAG: efflux RND transporter periplasmic adaptor subunit [Acidobacteria bacterium]|nr:efflux RND transporter periplasmic adaptor subunit [Acidobacteriota bacterium]MCG2815513.1 efflux RND transporter periplasmic adaptor subunit [Candidatus Aminicenantes bacterium]
MKKLTQVMIVLMAVIGLLSCQPPAEKEQAAEQSIAAAPVWIVEVQRQSISEKLTFTGSIEAVRKMNITPDIGGKIDKIYVEEGDSVREGQLLMELDTRAIRLQLDQTQAGLAASEANYMDARINKERMERLSRENAVSDQQFEKILLAYEAAEAQVQQARAALKLVLHQLDVSILKAPFSGIVASKNAEVGDVINPMMGGLGAAGGVLILMDFSRVNILIDVSHQDIVRLKKGQPAVVKLSVYPEREFLGKVSIINFAADPITRKFRVEIQAPNPDGVLRPNSFGEVVIDVNSHDNALVIPQSAVLENSYVFVMKNNQAVRTAVKLGLQNTSQVEVLEGLTDGDRVIVRGNYGLEDGSPVIVKEEQK